MTRTSVVIAQPFSFGYVIEILTSAAATAVPSGQQ
jgi:hypothetical protein